MPGESTSMASEACDLLPPEEVIVFENSAMNYTHKRHMYSTYENGYANLLLENIKFMSMMPQAADNSSTTETIAKAIVDDFDLSLTKKANYAAFFKPNDDTKQAEIKEAISNSANIFTVQ